MNRLRNFKPHPPGAFSRRANRTAERTFWGIVGMWTLILGSLWLLSGCAKYENLTPQQSLFALTETYIAVGSEVVRYVQLPNCETSPLALCANATVVKELRRADRIFYHALVLAREHRHDTSAELYRAAADRALVELRALLVRSAVAATLKGTPS